MRRGAESSPHAGSMHWRPFTVRVTVSPGAKATVEVKVADTRPSIPSVAAMVRAVLEKAPITVWSWCRVYGVNLRNAGYFKNWRT